MSRINQNEPYLIYKDKNFLAVYKPANLLVHSVKKLKIKNRNTEEIEKATLVNWLIKNFPEIKNVGDFPQVRPGIVHRLDRDTSGIILIARNQNYFEYLKHLFQNHQIRKIYLALVYGKVEPRRGIIEKPIRLKPGTLKRTVWAGKMEKEAITEYKVIKFLKLKSDTISGRFFSFVEVMPKTGRTHQIRVHFAAIGHPIVGDSLYGPKENPFNLKRLFLHAESLEFSTAEGRRIKISAELPPELKEIITDFCI